MRLVIENGGTKCDWILVENDFYISTSNILINDIDKNNINYFKSFFPTYILCHSNITIDVYTAGLNELNIVNIKSFLSNIFSNPTIEIYSDMLAASRALFHQKCGIACILGTGSNTAFYDGENNHEIRFSSGYIFGDEGSGYDLGKQFLINYFNDKLPMDIKNNFESIFQINKKTLLANIYSLNNPKSYIASFSKFVFNYKHDPFIYQIINDSILNFLFSNPFLYKDFDQYQFGFIGSVSFYYSDIISKIMEKKSIKFKIIKQPIFSLKSYYLR